MSIQTKLAWWVTKQAGIQLLFSRYGKAAAQGALQGAMGAVTKQTKQDATKVAETIDTVKETVKDKSQPVLETAAATASNVKSGLLQSVTRGTKLVRDQVAIAKAAKNKATR